MALSENDLSEIEKLLTAEDLQGPVFGELRRRFPTLSWTQCDASDVTEDPFRTYSKFDIHLLDTADHCAHITSDPGRATGVILARRSA
ncbi:hypothetical protein V5F59_15530 [Xanthobacter autotrophicus DSM 431]|uniref:hypothetical protein n=1 Tax=Xanthobacter nonsaccharivorans TaxID=3119912 RepID=UPI00372BEDE3